MASINTMLLPKYYIIQNKETKKPDICVSLFDFEPIAERYADTYLPDTWRNTHEIVLVTLLPAPF